MTVTDEMLIAYADGEADPDVAAAVEAAVSREPALGERLARHRALRERLGTAFGGVLDEPLPERLAQTIACAGPGVIDLGQARARRRPPVWAPIGMAACLALGLALGAGWQARGPIGPGMAARASLAAALDRQLAGEDQAGKAVRVAVSFRRANGGYCRTFQIEGEQGLAGVACREDRRWRVIAAVRAPATATQFRTAASLPAPVAGAVDSLIVGEPLDAAAEARARESGWR